MSVLLQVVEVGEGAGADQADRRRLRAITQRMSGLSKLFVYTWCVDSRDGAVATTAPLGGWLAGRSWLAGLAARAASAPRGEDGSVVAAEPIAPEPAAFVPAGGAPWLTVSILAVLAVAFVVELVAGVKPWTGLLSPDILTLVACGGLTRSLVQEGEWYRFLTAAFLHGDLVHLFLNGLALVLAGTVLEPLLGRVWMLALFVLGALGGSTLSYLLNPADVVSVGASGAIMGLLAAAFVSSFRLPVGSERQASQMLLLRVLVPSLIPLATTHGEGNQIDYAGHLGGALVGVLLGVFLLKTWPRSRPRPRFVGAAAVVAGVGIAALAVSVVLVARERGAYATIVSHQALEAYLLPDSEVAKLRSGRDEDIDSVADLSDRYPRDPRARWASAARLVRGGKLAEAEAELRVALGQTEILRAFFPDRKLELQLYAFLAAVLLDEGKPAEAREAVAPVCKAGEGGKVPEALADLHVCD
jgi:rhomboid protease GluP